MKATPLITLLTALLATRVVGSAKPDAGIPRDFRVTIHDYPGLSDWKPFETTIMADGTVLQTVFDKKQPKQKRFKIANGKVVALFDEIRRADFFSLADKYPTDAEDCATFVITVRADGRSHAVTFATCFRKPGTEAESKRFLKVWAAALRAYPSPNRDQKAEDYER